MGVRRGERRWRRGKWKGRGMRVGRGRGGRGEGREGDPERDVGRGQGEVGRRGEVRRSATYQFTYVRMYCSCTPLHALCLAQSHAIQHSNAQNFIQQLPPCSLECCNVYSSYTLWYSATGSEWSCKLLVHS